MGTHNLALEQFPEEEWNKEWSRSNIKINFTIRQNTPQTLSILFDILLYGKGAAHPVERIATLNFLNGQQVELEELFTTQKHYLKPISEYCFNKLLKETPGEETQ